jgi:hypothetical protein
MRRAALRAAVVAVVLMIAPLAHAEDPNMYLGLGLGYSRIKFDSADFSFNDPLVTENKKYADAGYKLALGYQINRGLAIEGAYVTLGKFQYTYNDSRPLTTGSLAIDYKVTGFAISLLPTIPFGRSFSLYGRLGAFFSDTTYTVAQTSGFYDQFLGDETRRGSAVSPLAGLGMQVNIGNDTDLRLEYENYGRVGTVPPNGPGRANVQMGSANLIFRF